MAKKIQNQRTGLRYIGQGAYLPGLPARDLTGNDLVEYAAVLAAMETAGTLASLYEPMELAIGDTPVEKSSNA